MNILAIESSSSLLSVAVLSGDRLSESVGAGGNSHSDLVLPLVDSVLRDARLRLESLDGIAFGAGPGAFTGLRMACSVAQGLAFAKGLPLVGVGSLEALALQAQSKRVATCVDARMNEVYFAAYEVDALECRIVVAPQAVAPDQIPDLSGSGWVAVGDGFAAYGGAAALRLASRIERVESSLVATAGSVARLARGRLERGERGERMDPAFAAPIYVREKVALTTAERFAKGGKA